MAVKLPRIPKGVKDPLVLKWMQDITRELERVLKGDAPGTVVYLDQRSKIPIDLHAGGDLDDKLKVVQE